MPYPSPTSPTINDLQYQSFSAIAPFGNSPQVQDATVTSESVTLNFVGYTGSVSTEEFTTTSENISVVPQATGDTTVRLFIGVSDTTVTSENVNPDFVGFNFGLKVTDTTVTSENVLGTYG